MHSSADLENGVPALASIAGMNMKPIPEEPVQSDHLATPEAGTADPCCAVAEERYSAQQCPPAACCELSAAR
ncbi:hypothetical protein EOD39_20597 [Acipenser ruthenus]|uniref:Uncharacterized protein n=1 Tax=Acipenser ruthenus TaxID=7906 RepID=A0A444UV05_ACIRT|nr:hypothetical protein EOD39_20597 [Acipenser ruthenus]